MQLAAMIEEFDADGDGLITEEDFFNIMHQSSLY
jgi:Ca2+-binding EF-hand superfamily protein